MPPTCQSCGKRVQSPQIAYCGECPSPDEIAAEAAKIRDGWSERERRRRAPHLKPQRWTMPEVSVSRDDVDSD